MKNIEDHIRKAMEEGKFENLPGKGKPLRLDENPFEDPAWRMANHMLQSSGYTLPWIQQRKELQAELEAARQALARAWAWKQDALSKKRPPASERPASEPPVSIEAEWARAVKVFQEQIAALNRQIFNYNLQTPSEQFQIRKINAEREIEAISGVKLAPPKNASR